MKKKFNYNLVDYEVTVLIYFKDDYKLYIDLTLIIKDFNFEGKTTLNLLNLSNLHSYLGGKLAKMCSEAESMIDYWLISNEVLNTLGFKK